MSGIVMMIIAIVVLGGAYLLYGRYLQNKWGIDPKAKTPKQKNILKLLTFWLNELAMYSPQNYCLSLRL